jgi:hypothetical protein
MNNVLPFKRPALEEEVDLHPLLRDDEKVWVCCNCKQFTFYIVLEGTKCATCGRFQVYD